MKNVILIIIVLISIGLVFYFGYQYTKNMAETKEVKQDLEITVLQEGTGEGAKNGDNLKVHYSGSLLDGTEFDSNIGKTPFSFVLGAGKVIEGWDKGLLGMKVGEKRKLIIPSDMGYGEYGAGDLIPPNSTLVFEVELLSINE